MTKRRISKVRRLGTCAVPTFIETESKDQDEEEASENNATVKHISRLGNKKRRQSIGSSKENTRKVQDLIQGGLRINFCCLRDEDNDNQR